MSELAVVIPPESTLAVFTNAGSIDPYLEQIKAEKDAFIKTADISTPAGRAAITSFAYKLAKIKNQLDGIGKDLAAEQKKIPALIDKTRADVWDKIEAWQKEVRKPLTDWEDAEKARVEKLNQRIAQIIAIGGGDGMLAFDSSQAIEKRLEEINNTEIDDSWQEFKRKAQDSKAASIATLTAAYQRRKKQEDDEAELKRLRDEAAARQRRENEERIAREAAEEARRQAEAEAERQRKAAEAAAKAELEAVERAARAAQAEADRKAQEAENARLAAIRKAEQDAETARQREAALERQRKQAEADKKAAEERAAKAEKEAKAKAERELAEKQAAEAEELRKREADKAHRGKINRAAVAAFVEHAGLTDEQAKAVVTAIAGKKIPAVAINY